MTPIRTSMVQFHPILNIPQVVNYPISHPISYSNKDNSYVIDCQKKNQFATEKQNPCLEIEKGYSENKNQYLSVDVIQKMIMRLLTEKQIPEEKLAEHLGITAESLLKLCSCRASTRLIIQINLPLIKLYCKTNFNNQKEKTDAINRFKKNVSQFC